MTELTKQEVNYYSWDEGQYKDFLKKLVCFHSANDGYATVKFTPNKLIN